MRIALDYDGTYTADPGFWDKFIALCKEGGHEIFILTKRGVNNQGESAPVNGVKTYYSNRRAKARWAEENGVPVTIWIDDAPGNLFVDG